MTVEPTIVRQLAALLDSRDAPLREEIREFVRRSVSPRGPSARRCGSWRQASVALRSPGFST